MNRRKFTLTSLAVCTTATMGTQLRAQQTNRDEAQSIPKPVAFKIDEPVEIDTQSTPVMWRKRPVHLLTLNQIAFSLHDGGRHLTGKVDGSMWTFDDVDYDVSAVVFSTTGELLGTSRAVCKVPRRWAGRCAMLQTSLTLDFGISNDFPHATSFLVCISNRDVLTPDQWQNG